MNNEQLKMKNEVGLQLKDYNRHWSVVSSLLSEVKTL